MRGPPHEGQTNAFQVLLGTVVRDLYHLRLKMLLNYCLIDPCPAKLGAWQAQPRKGLEFERRVLLMRNEELRSGGS